MSTSIISGIFSFAISFILLIGLLDLIHKKKQNKLKIKRTRLCFTFLIIVIILAFLNGILEIFL